MGQWLEFQDFQLEKLFFWAVLIRSVCVCEAKSVVFHSRVELKLHEVVASVDSGQSYLLIKSFVCPEVQTSMLDSSGIGEHEKMHLLYEKRANTKLAHQIGKDSVCTAQRSRSRVKSRKGKPISGSWLLWGSTGEQEPHIKYPEK